MKQLPPGPAPWTPEPLPTWVVFEVATLASGDYQLREVAKVQAGNEASAIITAVESRKDQKGGPRIAMPLERLRGPAMVSIHVFATVSNAE